MDEFYTNYENPDSYNSDNDERENLRQSHGFGDEEDAYGESQNANENVLLEHDGVVMDGPNGNGLADRTGNGKNSGLPKADTSMKEMGKAWPRKQKNTGGSTEEFGNSKHVEANDGHTTHLRDSKLGSKQKNTGGQWETVGGMAGGGKQMHENIMALSNHVRRMIKEHVQDSQELSAKRGSYPVLFRVSAGNIVKPMERNQLTEALADAEELIQIMGPDPVNFEVAFYGKDGYAIESISIPMISLPKRGPAMVEHNSLFRHPVIARGFADSLACEGVTCRAASHNWGATVSAKINQSTAMKHFQGLRPIS